VSYCHYFSSVVRRPSVNISHFNLLLWNCWTKLSKPGRDGSWGVPFKIVSDSHTLHSRWLLLLEIEISLIVHWYKSTVRKIAQTNAEYMLNYSLPCSCSEHLSWFWPILKQQWTIEEIFIFSNSSHLEWRDGLSDTIFKRTQPGIRWLLLLKI
jgi:hypothetical protein